MIACPTVATHIMFDPARINEVGSLEAARLKYGSAFSSLGEKIYLIVRENVKENRII